MVMAEGGKRDMKCQVTMNGGNLGKLDGQGRIKAVAEADLDHILLKISFVEFSSNKFHINFVYFYTTLICLLFSIFLMKNLTDFLGGVLDQDCDTVSLSLFRHSSERAKAEKALEELIHEDRGKIGAWLGAPQKGTPVPLEEGAKIELWREMPSFAVKPGRMELGWFEAYASLTQAHIRTWGDGTEKVTVGPGIMVENPGWGAHPIWEFFPLASLVVWEEGYESLERGAQNQSAILDEPRAKTFRIEIEREMGNGKMELKVDEGTVTCFYVEKMGEKTRLEAHIQAINHGSPEGVWHSASGKVRFNDGKGGLTFGCLFLVALLCLASFPLVEAGKGKKLGAGGAMREMEDAVLGDGASEEDLSIIDENMLDQVHDEIDQNVYHSILTQISDQENAPSGSGPGVGSAGHEPGRVEESGEQRIELSGAERAKFVFGTALAQFLSSLGTGMQSFPPHMNVPPPPIQLCQQPSTSAVIYEQRNENPPNNIMRQPEKRQLPEPVPMDPPAKVCRMDPPMEVQPAQDQRRLCFVCNQAGHLARQCANRKRSGGGRTAPTGNAADGLQRAANQLHMVASMLQRDNAAVAALLTGIASAIVMLVNQLQQGNNDGNNSKSGR